MVELYDKAKKIIDQSANILIVSHRGPDADTLGGGAALALWMRMMGKTVSLACVDSIPRRFRFLPLMQDYVKDFEMDQYDAIVVVDAGASYMTDFHLKYEGFLKLDLPLINIDHHASNDNFGTLNIVDPQAASVTVILYRMFKYFDVEIDSEMATCLLAGIYNDTGSFMHSNTDEEVYEIAADLMNKGAQLAFMSQSMFRRNRVSTLRLWGRTLEKAYLTDDGVVMSVITGEDYDDAQAGPDQLSGVVEYLSMVPESNYALLVNEDRKGNIKGSLRTRNDDVDVSLIAKKFGGGGHPKASGFSMKGDLVKSISYEIQKNDEEGNKLLKF